MYWSAIWNAGGFIILFFLMEEASTTRLTSRLTLTRIDELHQSPIRDATSFQRRPIV